MPAEQIQDFVVATVLAFDPHRPEARPVLQAFFIRTGLDPQKPNFGEALQRYYTQNPIAPLLKALLTEHLTDLVTIPDDERREAADRSLGTKAVLTKEAVKGPVSSRGALGFFSAKKILGID